MLYYIYCVCVQDFKPRIHVSESDFVTMTMNGLLCDSDGCLGIMYDPGRRMSPSRYP